MSWLQFHLTVEKPQVDLLELLFEKMGALSITFIDAKDEPHYEPPIGETPLWSLTTITALFSGDSDADALQMQISQALNNDISRQLKIEILEDQEWERAWLDNFHPMQFGQNLWVCPNHKEPPSDAKTVVYLDPGLAFGTGTHPTTALCLEWLGNNNIKGKRIIDFGCGSGILAIAALKLGAKEVIAVDHDPQAIIACNNNAEANHVAEKLQCYLPDDFQTQTTDIVLANILANVLIELKDEITALLAPNSQLILSGILTEQADMVIEAYAETLPLEQSNKEDWCRLVGRY